MWFCQGKVTSTHPHRTYSPPRSGEIKKPNNFTGDSELSHPNAYQVNIVLESGQVDYRPTMVNLTHVTNVVAKELIGTVDTISRVRKALGDSIDTNILPKKTVTVATPASQGSPAAVASDSAEGETNAKGSGTSVVQTVGDGDGDGIETRQLSQVKGGPITRIKGKLNSVAAALVREGCLREIEQAIVIKGMSDGLPLYTTPTDGPENIVGSLDTPNYLGESAFLLGQSIERTIDTLENLDDLGSSLV